MRVRSEQFVESREGVSDAVPVQRVGDDACASGRNQVSGVAEILREGRGSLSCLGRAFGTMKKRTKKLFPGASHAAPTPEPEMDLMDKSFLLLFFKKEALS